MKRSMTMSSPSEPPEPLLVKSPSIQLPDIIPSPPEPVLVPKETTAPFIERKLVQLCALPRILFSFFHSRGEHRDRLHR